MGGGEGARRAVFGSRQCEIRRGEVGGSGDHSTVHLVVGARDDQGEALEPVVGEVGGRPAVPPVVAVVLGFSVAAQLVEHGQSSGTEATVRVENKGREVHVVLVTLGFVLLVLLFFLREEGAAVGVALEWVADAKVELNG